MHCKIANPKVSIIIVNWDGVSFLDKCFEALFFQTFQDFEIIFVDNGSLDNSIETVNALFDLYGFAGSIIKIDHNTGFTGGNIEGLKHCSGKYIALLNNDTEVESLWLENLVYMMDTYPSIGICGSKQIMINTDKIDEAGHILLTSLNVYARGRGEHISKYSHSEYVPSICAAATIYRKSMIDDIGFFDSDFFLDCEDIDLAFRAQLAGWKVAYCPTAIVHHHVGGTKSQIKGLAEFYNSRNKKLMFLKNMPFILLLYYLPCFIIGEYEIFLYNIKINNLKGYIMSWVSFSCNIGLYLEKRKEVIRKKRVSNKYIKGLFRSAFESYKDKYLK